MKRDMANVPYDPQWPVVFERLSTVLTESLGDLILRIEHVGSTAIPGLAAKPRIDLDLVIGSQIDLAAVSQKLVALGYIPQGDLGRPGREAFGRADEFTPHTEPPTAWMKHNLYVCPHDSPMLAEHVQFRDYLISHPEVAHEYALLKQELVISDRFDQDAYVAGKSRFVEEVLARCNRM
jgi:GrpB-like predicted nucleotidyltransferase (UPF0157 family)